MLEWIAGAIGLVIVVVALVLLVREVRRPVTPPDIAVQLDSVTAGRHAYVVHFTAHNAGTSPASGVGVVATLVAPGDSLESSATLDHLPGGARRHGGVFFPIDPRTRELRMRVVGYREP